jgi:hypothetical protein
MGQGRLEATGIHHRDDDQSVAVNPVDDAQRSTGQ